ncbi:hypothetical protein AVEN_127193-1 [Araneus ventricosus]|uniref:Uncharacterized protein n=1 Tax=Araneus ventricosus TaxID=182803 RepID=A0A4Y2P4I1_ARAVE|nr:hypothetical protein AVEN_127193-1 [Araneus ventricosus]
MTGVITDVINIVGERKGVEPQSFAAHGGNCSSHNLQVLRCLFQKGSEEWSYLFPIVRKHSATTSRTDRGVSNCGDPWVCLPRKCQVVSVTLNEDWISRWKREGAGADV